ncbi:MAG TPA: hypothetical protein VF666_14455 [Pyrinomonadaceae bacterium]
MLNARGGGEALPREGLNLWQYNMTRTAGNDGNLTPHSRMPASVPMDAKRAFVVFSSDAWRASVFGGLVVTVQDGVFLI